MFPQKLTKYSRECIIQWNYLRKLLFEKFNGLQSNKNSKIKLKSKSYLWNADTLKEDQLDL